MGESLSKLGLSENDPRYNGVKDKYRNLDTEALKLVNEFLKEQDKLQSKNGYLNEENVKLRKKIDHLNSEIKRGISMKGQFEMSTTTGHSTNKIFEDLLDEQNDLKTMIQTLQNERERLMKDNEKLRSDNKVLSNEHESALSRLSKIAGIQLTKGNSDIADLSDVNRPTKLAEKYSSLYTEEWLEAYDEITMGRTIKNENNKCEKELCNIFKSCYNICQDLERKQMQEIKVHAWDIACSLHQQADQLVSEAKTTKFFVLNATHIDGKEVNAAPSTSNQQEKMGFDIKILAIHKCMEELIEIVHERRKYDKQLLEYVKQETLKHFEQCIKPRSKDRVLNYVRKCTELCWNMVIKNPSMILACDQLEGKPVDKSMFTFYTKEGPVVDFVVWPALLLHMDGPMLHKGVVQGKENGVK